MGILTNKWVRTATAGTLVMGLAGCPGMQPLPGETPREADSRVTNTTAAGAATICAFIKDSGDRNRCLLAGGFIAAASGDNARNQAARAGYCDDRRSGTKGANNPVTENCYKRSPW